MEIDTNTKVKVATGVRKAKKLFTGCKGENTDGGVTSAPDIAINTLGLAGFCIAIAAFPLASGGIVVDIIGSFLLAFCPYVIYQKKVLQGLKSFRSLLNQLRGKINELMAENDKLTENIERLKASVDDLETIESNFSRLAGSNNVDRLVEVIKETKDINAKIRKNTESQIVNHLITTVLSADTDGDLKIGPSEIQDLCTRLGREKQFKFNKDKFLRILGGGKKEVPVEQVMKVIKNLKNQDLPISERIFTIEGLSKTRKGI